MSRQEDKTQLKLLYANQSPSDTVLLSELRELQRKYPQQLEVRYLVEHMQQPEQTPSTPAVINGMRVENDDFSVGRPCAKTIRGFLPGPLAARTAVLVCGPEGMMEALCGGIAGDRSAGVPRLGGVLRSMGYGRQVVQFSDTNSL